MKRPSKWEMAAPGSRNLLKAISKKKIWLCAFGNRRFNIEAPNQMEASYIARFWDAVLICEVKRQIAPDTHPDDDIDIDLADYGIEFMDLGEPIDLEALDLTIIDEDSEGAGADG